MPTGNFSVALAAKVDPNTTAIVTAANAAAPQVQGLGVGVNEVKAAPIFDVQSADRSKLEVWLVHSPYVNDQGAAHAKTSGGNDFYKIHWDAYAVAAPGKSVAAVGSFAGRKVGFYPSATGSVEQKPARRGVAVHESF